MKYSNENINGIFVPATACGEGENWRRLSAKLSKRAESRNSAERNSMRLWQSWAEMNKAAACMKIMIIIVGPKLIPKIIKWKKRNEACLTKPMRQHSINGKWQTMCGFAFWSDYVCRERQSSNTSFNLTSLKLDDERTRARNWHSCRSREEQAMKSERKRFLECQ